MRTQKGEKVTYDRNFLENVGTIHFGASNPRLSRQEKRRMEEAKKLQKKLKKEEKEAREKMAALKEKQQQEEEARKEETRLFNNIEQVALMEEPEFSSIKMKGLRLYCSKKEIRIKGNKSHRKPYIKEIVSFVKYMEAARARKELEERSICISKIQKLATGTYEGAWNKAGSIKVMIDKEKRVWLKEVTGIYADLEPWVEDGLFVPGQSLIEGKFKTEGNLHYRKRKACQNLVKYLLILSEV